MVEVKWIKITTNMFEDEKIDFIESLPEADTILVIWVKLLTLTGKCNAGGYIFLTENIPYTDEMLAHKFRRPLNVIKLALETFRKLEMIDIDEKGIFICNFEKHQNLEKLEAIREYNRLAKQKEREKKKFIGQGNVNDIQEQVNQCQETDIDIDKDIDKESTIIFSHWNSKKIIEHRKLNDKTKRVINGALKDYSQDEINQAIDNYAFILRSENHYFSYKWGLKEFMERGIEKFKDFDTADHNYRNKPKVGEAPPSNEPKSWQAIREFMEEGDQN